MEELTKTQFRRAIPKELQDDIRFVGFNLIPKKDKDGKIELLSNGKVKYTKIPINPQTGKWARCNDSRTWSFLGTSLAKKDIFKYDGIGIMLGKGVDGYSLVGIDLDHVLIDGSPNKDNIENIVKTLNSYTELSPSKTGIHILLKVKDEQGILKSKRTEVNGDSFEFYKADRFFTLTGNKYKTKDGKTFDNLRIIEPLELKNILKNTLSLDLDKGNSAQKINLNNKSIGETSKELHENILKDNFSDIGSQGLTTDRILKYIANEKNGNKYQNILQGYTSEYPSVSEAEFDICKKLAFYTDSPKQINDIIVNSGLIRDKWFELRGNMTYGILTILNALNATKHKFGEAFRTNSNIKNENVKVKELEL